MAVGLSALGAAAYLTGFRPRSQIFGPFPYAAETDEKIVALSFDDGPNEPYTTQLLNTLDRYDVKATFFQVGRCALRFPSSTRRVVESGHVLGNHSYSHSFTRYLKEPRQEIEISRSQEVFYSITGLGTGQCATARTSGGVGNLRPSSGDLPARSRQVGRFGRTADAPGHDLDLPRRLRGARWPSRPERGSHRAFDRSAGRSGLSLHHSRPIARAQRLHLSLIARSACW